MSTLMDSWIGWSHEICGREDQYQEKKQNIVAAQQQHPSPVVSFQGLREQDEQDEIAAASNQRAAAAIEAGKHVLCEKPYTRHPEQVDEAFFSGGTARGG